MAGHCFGWGFGAHRRANGAYRPGGAVPRITTAEIAAIPQVVGLWNPNEPASLFEEGSGQTAIDTGTPSTLGGPVGTQRDWSGNNHHRIITLPAARPTVASLGGRTVLSYDGADDNLRCDDWRANTSNMRLFMGLQTTDTEGLMFNAGTSPNPWLGAFKAGDTVNKSLAEASVQLGQWIIDGVAYISGVNSRDEAYQATATGAPVVHEFVGANLAASAWYFFGSLFYGSLGFDTQGLSFLEIAVDESVTPLTADELALIRAYMAQETRI